METTLILRIMPLGPVRSQRAIETHAGLDLIDVEAVTPSEESIRGREIACSMAHARVMERFLASEADFAVVLEDDAILDVDRSWMSHTEFDLFIPFAEGRKYLVPNSTIRFGTLPKHGTFAFVCSRRFAERFLSRLKTGEVADYANHMAAQGLRIGSFVGNLVNHDNHCTSLISEKRRFRFIQKEGRVNSREIPQDQL